MSDTDRIDRAGRGQFLVPRGLLGTKAKWFLPLGLTQALPLRWAARVLIASATLLFLGWVLALLLQASSGRGAAPWAGLGLAVVLGVPWLTMAGRLWRSLHQRAMLPLCWGGLPPNRAADRSQAAPAGWSVPGWPHPVSVRVVFDLGSWVLVKITSGGPRMQPLAWVWLDALEGFQSASGHHLRALLFNPRANEVGIDLVLAAGKQAVVASSRDLQRQWFNLLSSFKTSGLKARSGANQRGVGVQGAVMSNSDFATTVILDFSHQALRGGRP